MAFITACQLASAGEPWLRHTVDDSSRGADGVKLFDFNGDDLHDIVTGWEEGGITRLYLHPGHAKARQRWPAVVVGKTPSVEDATPVDIDSDGAADVVSCCECNTRAVFVHWNPGEAEKLLDATAWQTKPLPESVGRMMWMFCAPMQVDGKRASTWWLPVRAVMPQSAGSNLPRTRVIWPPGAGTRSLRSAG